MENQKHIKWIFGGILFGLFLAAPVINTNLYDDAYIHARIAENFLAYGVPIFNNGEIFKIGSSTGFVLLVAILSKIFGTIGAIRALEFCSIFLTIIGLFLLAGWSKEKSIKNIFPLLCIIPFLLHAAYGGMESPIVCMLIVGAAVAYIHEKHALVLLFVALCTWFRFETTLLFFVTFFYYWFSSKNKSILLFSTPFFALVVTDLFFFGNIIPHAAKVKSIVYGFPLIKSVLNVLSFSAGKSGYVFGLFLFTIFIIKGTQIVHRRFRITFSDILIIFSAGVFLAWMLGGTLIFQWYYTLLSFPFGIAVILGFNTFPETPSFAERSMRNFDFLVLTGFGILGLKVVLASFGILGSEPSALRVDRYRDIGAGLYSLCPSCKLLTSEIGGLGYSFKGEVYDAFGLGDPDAVKFHPMKVPEERNDYSVGAIPPKYVAYRNPDFVVSMPIFSKALRSSGLLNTYTRYDCPLGKNQALNIWGDNKIQIFSKKIFPSTTLLTMSCEKVN